MPLSLIRKSLNQLTIHHLIAAIICLSVLYYANLYSFLFFHVLIEIFSVVVSFAIFVFAWNSRGHVHNSTLSLLGSAYLIIGAIDLLHTFSYKGMGVFNSYGADTATQLWIAARYIESLTLFIAPLIVSRNISMPRAIVFYLVLFVFVISTIFFWPIFPSCFIEGQGLTPFKKASEYVIAAILLSGLVNLFHHRTDFEGTVYGMLAVSILFTIISELMFTFYISVYGISNLVGHLFKVASFWLIYKAILETGLQQPFALLFRKLAQSEKRFRELVDMLPTGICEIDVDFSVSYINPAGLKLIGYEAADVQKGLNLSMVLDSENQQKAQQRFKEFVDARSIESTGYQLFRKDGKKVDVIVNSTPIYQDGKLNRIQASLTDVTEINRLQKQLQQTRKMEAISILAGGMAHKINNMLMGVVGRLDLLKIHAHKDRQLDADVNEIVGGCDQIAKLVQDLLAYSRGGRYQTEIIDVREFLLHFLEEYEKKISPKVQLIYSFSPQTIHVSADQRQLETVFTEIMANAEEAIQSSGQIEIEIDTESINSTRTDHGSSIPPGTYMRLKVCDTGEGMDDETVQHIFDPFYSNKFPGRGLGMAAVFGIVKSHGGLIHIDSKPGQGTTVYLFLPVHDESSHVQKISSVV